MSWAIIFEISFVCSGAKVLWGCNAEIDCEVFLFLCAEQNRKMSLRHAQQNILYSSISAQTIVLHVTNLNVSVRDSILFTVQT